MSWPSAFARAAEAAALAAIIYCMANCQARVDEAAAQSHRPIVIERD